MSMFTHTGPRGWEYGDLLKFDNSDVWNLNSENLFKIRVMYFETLILDYFHTFQKLIIIINVCNIHKKNIEKHIPFLLRVRSC